MTGTDGKPENDDVAFVDQPEGKPVGDGASRAADAETAGSAAGAAGAAVDDPAEKVSGDSWREVVDDVTSDADAVNEAGDASTADDAEPASDVTDGTPSSTVSATSRPDESGRAKDRDEARPGSTGPTTMREDLGTLADEGRRLFDAVESRFVAPLVRSYPEVARHLGAAGREIAAAVRTAVRGQEQVWRDRTGPDAQQEKITVERVDSEKERPGSGTTED